MDNTPELIDGNAIADGIYEQLKQVVSKIDGRKPRVVFIRVGEDPASRFYVSKKQKVAESLGIVSRVIVLPETITQEELIAEVRLHNEELDTDGILVQAPLPKHIYEQVIFNAVDPRKDVDGFNEINCGKLFLGDAKGFVSCTPQGVIHMLQHAGVKTQGAHVVVMGRSLIVGRPLAILLARKHEMGNATVTLCHSRTQNLAEITRKADILIAAMGMPLFVKKEMVKPGAVVIDVGINRYEDSTKNKGYRIVGDVDFDAVAPIASKITPVPGGVGPMTVAMLMRNTVKAYQARISQ